MPNLDNPLGFIPARQGGAGKPNIIRRTLATSAKVYPGQLSKNSAGLVTAVTAESDNVTGVVIGYADQALSSAVDKAALVVENLEDVIFRVQCDGAVAEADIGAYFKPLVVSSDTALKVSRFELDYSTKTTTIGKAGGTLGARWELLGKVNEPGNDWGANCDVLVRFRRNLDA